MGDKYGVSSPSSGYCSIEAPFGAREVFDYPTFRFFLAHVSHIPLIPVAKIPFYPVCSVYPIPQ